MEKEKAANAVFKHIWVTFPVTANEAGTLDKLFADADATAEIKELAMAATMLSLLEHYSEHLLLSLLDLYAANAFNDAVNESAVLRADCHALPPRNHKALKRHLTAYCQHCRQRARTPRHHDRVSAIHPQPLH